MKSYFIGIDLGTSGCRAIAIDEANKVLAQSKVAFTPKQVKQPSEWWYATSSCLHQVINRLTGQLPQAISVDGTSTTLLFCHPDGRPLTPVLMYDDPSAQQFVNTIRQYAPPNACVQSATASLPKYLYLRQHITEPCIVVHQADWVIGSLCGNYTMTDENNALKLGYDVHQKKWPDWLQDFDIHQNDLPNVVPPGTVIGQMTQVCAKQLGLSNRPCICSGTTDSTAAFIATGASKTGDAVTSLGSTLVVKILSDQPVNVPELGIYSHSLGQRWIIGGASNSGGHVLQHFFSEKEINTYSLQLKPFQPTGLAYYPLIEAGERFPIYDLNKQPKFTPKPSRPGQFFQAILEGITAIEKQSYEVLVDCGAPTPTSLYSVGGGSQNKLWTQLRSDQLSIPMKQPCHTEAAFGTALLAKQGWLRRES